MANPETESPNAITGSTTSVHPESRAILSATHEFPGAIRKVPDGNTLWMRQVSRSARGFRVKRRA